MEKLVKEAVFGKNKKRAEEKIKKLAQENGIFLNSTQKLYERIAQGKVGGFTTPAFNIRTLTFDVFRALFRAVKREKVGAFIIELAESEIGYTVQPLEEYLSCVLAASLKENFKGTIFLQGDHFKIERKKELKDLENLIKSALRTGFYNIDIDGSPLIAKDKETLFSQQKENFLMTAKFINFIRKIEPRNLTVSIGGEVGIIGGENTREEELKVFMDGITEELAKDDFQKGLIKIAVQTGTSHGGIMLSHGELKVPEEDFKTLKELSREAKKYGLAGAVQHGASTLPERYFEKFPETGACEIHLATIFQNIIYESNYFPQALKEKIYQWLKKNYIKEKKEKETDIQFFYRLRKKALGPFKKEIWSIPQKKIDKICEELEEKFIFFFKALNVSGTEDLIDEIYRS